MTLCFRRWAPPSLLASSSATSLEDILLTRSGAATRCWESPPSSAPSAYSPPSPLTSGSSRSRGSSQAWAWAPWCLSRMHTCSSGRPRSGVPSLPWRSRGLRLRWALHLRASLASRSAPTAGRSGGDGCCSCAWHRGSSRCPFASFSSRRAPTSCLCTGGRKSVKSCCGSWRLPTGKSRCRTDRCSSYTTPSTPPHGTPGKSLVASSMLRPSTALVRGWCADSSTTAISSSTQCCWKRCTT
mmetsp:Transcript_16070/g.32149  ORF Transcript_16070/g.32149 Transcript_16070/m.32149 type:complete len:241 (+) Transcript_16070:219-941(+)